jgi:hypothetical protein
VTHRRDRRGQSALSDASPAGVAGALDRGLALRQLVLGIGAGAAVDDQRRAGKVAQ